MEKGQAGAGWVEIPKIHPGKKDVSHGVCKIDGLCVDKPDTPGEIALRRKQTQSMLDWLKNGDAAELGSTHGSGVRSTLSG